MRELISSELNQYISSLNAGNFEKACEFIYSHRLSSFDLTLQKDFLLSVRLNMPTAYYLDEILLQYLNDTMLIDNTNDILLLSLVQGIVLSSRRSSSKMNDEFTSIFSSEEWKNRILATNTVGLGNKHRTPFLGICQAADKRRRRCLLDFETVLLVADTEDTMITLAGNKVGTVDYGIQNDTYESVPASPIISTSPPRVHTLAFIAESDSPGDEICRAPVVPLTTNSQTFPPPSASSSCSQDSSVSKSKKKPTEILAALLNTCQCFHTLKLTARVQCTAAAMVSLTTPQVVALLLSVFHTKNPFIQAIIISKISLWKCPDELLLSINDRILESNDFLPVLSGYVFGVLLVKIRSLRAPASRLFGRVVTCMVGKYPLLAIEMFARALCPCPRLVYPSSRTADAELGGDANHVQPTSFQTECIQRIAKQAFTPDQSHLLLSRLLTVLSNGGNVSRISTGTSSDEEAVLVDALVSPVAATSDADKESSGFGTSSLCGDVEKRWREALEKGETAGLVASTAPNTFTAELLSVVDCLLNQASSLHNETVATMLALYTSCPDEFARTCPHYLGSIRTLLARFPSQAVQHTKSISELLARLPQSMLVKNAIRTLSGLSTTSGGVGSSR